MKIQADPMFSTSVVIITTVAQDGRKREIVMLPIECLAGWLSTIKKAAPEVQAKLDEHRREAYHALDVWFRGGLIKRTMRENISLNPTLSLEK